MNAWKNKCTWLSIIMGISLICSAIPFRHAVCGDEKPYRLAPPELQPLKRPGAVFAHDAHNFKAGIENCSKCHHIYDSQGDPLPDESSAGISCAQCHFKAGQDTTPGLRRAYHMQCKNCHIQRKKGPVTCAGCHPD